MTNEEMARSYLTTAAYSLKQARVAHTDGVWHIVVRRCQEGVEMALKAVLRLAGLEIPKVHDVGFVVRKHEAQFPEWFQGHVDRVSHISRSLRKDREVSLYGDENLDLPSETIFSQVDADEAIADAAFVLDLAERLFTEVAGNDESER